MTGEQFAELLARSDEVLALARRTLLRVESLERKVALQGETIMSQITAYTDQVEAAFQKIQSEIQTQAKNIADLQQQLANSGNLSAADAAAMQKVVDEANALASSGTLTPPPAPAPAPAPDPAPPAPPAGG